jgi:hypothetical protein
MNTRIVDIGVIASLFENFDIRRGLLSDGCLERDQTTLSSGSQRALTLSEFISNFRRSVVLMTSREVHLLPYFTLSKAPFIERNTSLLCSPDTFSPSSTRLSCLKRSGTNLRTSDLGGDILRPPEIQ